MGVQGGLLDPQFLHGLAHAACRGESGTHVWGSRVENSHAFTNQHTHPRFGEKMCFVRVCVRVQITGYGASSAAANHFR